ncbi:transmembrane protein 81 [Chanos chanos]|uniref:Transmembrane protein 81 n=1 Tax=Chanos chanos TaxID=29144 RepID=A0A6J2W9R6_CHACN|nr:transmembrane protein 81 [Chanos chanos]
MCSWALLLSPSLSAAPLTDADLEELEAVSSWVIVHSSPCSVTCGLGLRTQQLCPVNDKINSATSGCRLRKVRCTDTWQCGLETLTVSAGEHLELDCLGEVMEAMGRFAFIVSWRYARGIVTTNNALFSRWKHPDLARIVLNPLREQDAGTYRCDVKDTTYRRVKRVYKGVKVLSPQVLSLNFDEALFHWEKPGNMSNMTPLSRQPYPSNTLRNMMLLSLCISVTMAMLVFLALYCLFYWKRPEKLCGTNCT